jgi:hypothetical protein
LRRTEEGEVTNSNLQDAIERRHNTPAVAFSLVFGIIMGTVVFAVTQDVFWIAFGSGLGIVVGAAFQANRR